MPEEALRDQIIQQARNCANYTTDGYCAMNGRFCSPLTDRYAIRAGGIDCAFCCAPLGRRIPADYLAWLSGGEQQRVSIATIRYASSGIIVRLR